MSINNGAAQKGLFRSKGFFIGYTLLVIIISSLITTACFHYFVLNQDPQESLFSISSSEIENSPIKDDKSIIEIFSYGCHYCAINEDNVAQLERRMPEGTRFVRLHISSDKTTGLGRFAPMFATLSVMGIESQHRASAYKAVLEDNIDFSDNSKLEAWLIANGIDVAKYQQVSQSAQVKELIAYMTAVTAHYNVDATPTFIVGKKWIALQDREFPAFSDHLLSLLEHDKALEK
ncbi:MULTISPECIES: DsbA family protein [Yersinia]|uniref:DsbA family protein n=1 Tax=Yersinia TaxID=629 RepID=UPI0005DD2D1B|nr:MULTISPECIES: DsbA family protein [Yersinia]OVZ96051.1 thiol:disulfide interchange protein [Yersinia frederiksenii]RXA96644.1 thiol:disulfide interchange protein [Yersinia sp. 2105 StPb PI]CNI75503.1 putative thiol:disulfide interchange protein [Yersinia frederiksenii]CNI77706.1 putative thiol:disulfide interchange protein [Yersinia frederiksenii]CNK52453.1 putative thiol:disulfide interchange protein [Yersinia frederiksenii]